MGAIKIVVELGKKSKGMSLLGLLSKKLMVDIFDEEEKRITLEKH